MLCQGFACLGSSIKITENNEVFSVKEIQTQFQLTFRGWESQFIVKLKAIKHQKDTMKNRV